MYCTILNFKEVNPGEDFDAFPKRAVSGSRPECTGLHHCMKSMLKGDSARYLTGAPPPPDGGIYMNKMNWNNSKTSLRQSAG